MRDPVTEQKACAETHGIFRLLGKPYMLDILSKFTREGPGPRRFVDLQGQLNISPNTLSGRLKELVQAGLLSRTMYNEIPPRVDYEATQNALDLCPVFEALFAWSMKHRLDVPIGETTAVEAV